MPLQARHHRWAGNGDHLLDSQYHHQHDCQILEQETAAVLTKGGQAGFSNLDEYFASMNKLVGEKKVSSRIRFLMQVRVECLGVFVNITSALRM